MARTITPFLWFEKDALEAAKFYVKIFKRSKILKSGPQTVTFRLDGQEFIALNGGPYYKINEAVSFFIACRTQKEIDHYWKKLSAGGTILQCGWVTDRYGVTWQVIPDILGKLLGDRNREKAARAHQAMMQMKKLDIAALRKAHAGK